MKTARRNRAAARQGRRDNQGDHRERYIIGQGKMVSEDWPVPVTFVLLALEPWAFRSLCDYGAELEDMEDTHDHESEVDEHTLGRSETLMQMQEESCDDAEPSLGPTDMTDQKRWHEGGSDSDLELNRADDEPSVGAGTLERDPCILGEQREYPAAADRAIIEEARSRFCRGHW
jgi:hypothetical protein